MTTVGAARRKRAHEGFGVVRAGKPDDPNHRFRLDGKDGIYGAADSSGCPAG
jgi:hypothetical protein